MPSTPTANEPPPQRASSRAVLLRVGLLGLNAWLVVSLVPVLAVGWGPPSAWAATGVPLLVLFAGLARLHASRRAARVALLALFPPALGLTWVLRPAAVEPGVYAAVAVSLSALSLLAYVAAAAQACARPADRHPATHFPIEGRSPLSDRSPVRWVRGALLASSAAGALCAVAVVPALGAPEGSWGEATREGLALTVVVAATVGSVALAAVVGPGLRAERRRRSRRAPLRRTVMASLGVALLGGLGWFALAHGHTF